MEIQEYRKLREKIKQLDGHPCNDHQYDMNLEQIDDLLGQFGLRILYRTPEDACIFRCTLIDECAGDIAMVPDEENGDLYEICLWTSYGEDASGKYVFRVDI